MQNATNITTGIRYVVKGFSNNIMAGKLMSMGILPDSELEVVRILPIVGNYYIIVDGQRYGLRKKEMEAIEVVPVAGEAQYL